MTTPNKLFIIQTQDGVVTVQEFGVEDNLDPVFGPVEQLYPPELVQNRVICVIRHIVRDDRRQRVSLQGEHPSLEQNPVLVGEQIFRIRNLCTVLARVSTGVFKDSLADTIGHLLDTVLELGGDSLTFESFDSVRVGSGGHDDECDDGGLGAHLLQAMIQPWTLFSFAFQPLSV